MLATLASLRIRNLALVEDLAWQIDPGFTAITGETGSGKSIIVGALQLILGERADKTLIRAGAESCTVEAVFSVGDAAALNRQLDEHGVEPCEDTELILKRVFSAAGTNRQFINGSATTLNVLRSLGDGMVDLHGPHDHQSLLSEAKQLDLLDSFAGAEALRSKYEEQYHRLGQLDAEYAQLSRDESALERELDLLRHQVREIESAQLLPNEEEAVLARYTVAANSRRLLELSIQVLGRLSDEDDAVLTRLAEIGKLLRELARIDPATSAFVDSHLRGATELEDAAGSLRRYADHLEIEPAQIAEMEQRVSFFESLKRKYGGSIEEVIAFGEQAGERLRKIESRAEELLSLEHEIELARAAVIEIGGKLGQKRKAGAPKLASSVAGHLADLGLAKSKFSVELASLEKPGPHGLESIAFVFAPNPGEPAKSLKAIASSGEISRVMLAVKSSLAAQDTIALLVFDEIDANVGGEIANGVAAKMRSLAKSHQVLCISHLPQVAAVADTQFVVTKDYIGGRTISQLRKVEGKARVEELARMLGGKTESSLAHAKSLLGAV